MTALPDPLTPPDCDLQEFAFMPLDVVRLRDSSIAIKATGDEFRCAVLLWCVAWHQIPAGSLPDDDTELAQYAGFGRVVKEWQKVRQGAMRGWVKCADGRLYHPVVAEKVNEAWAGRVKYAEKKEAERARKAEERRLKKQADEAAMNRQIPPDSVGMSEGQNGNVQRTDAGNPPENDLKETVDSGQWTVDSRQLPSKTKSSSHPAPPPPPEAKAEREHPGQPVQLDRHVQIALLLRAQGVNVTAANPLVAVTWGQNPKVTDDVLNIAVAKAKATLEKQGRAESPSEHYLKPIVEQLIAQQDAPPPAPIATAAAQPKRKPTGTEPKGPDESYDEWMARVDRAESERRKRQA